VLIVVLIRTKPDRLTVVGDGAVVVAPGEMGFGAGFVSAGILRIEPDRLVVVGDRAVVVWLGTKNWRFVQTVVVRATIVSGLCLVRVVRDQTAARRNALLVILPAQAHLAAGPAARSAFASSRLWRVRSSGLIDRARS
jgi:hypothetical protein